MQEGKKFVLTKNADATVSPDTVSFYCLDHLPSTSSLGKTHKELRDPHFPGDRAGTRNPELLNDYLKACWDTYKLQNSTPLNKVVQTIPKLQFVVRQNGQIDSLVCVRTSGDKRIDSLLMQATLDIPYWIPANYHDEFSDALCNLTFELKRETTNLSTVKVAIDNIPDSDMVENKKEDNDSVFGGIPNIVPHFPNDNGDGQVMMAWFAKNIQYPPAAQKNNIQGIATVLFIVGKDGSINDPKIIRSTSNDELDAEAIRVVKAMPKWVPASSGGKPVSMSVSLPIRFRLEAKK